MQLTAYLKLVKGYHRS